MVRLVCVEMMTMFVNFFNKNHTHTQVLRRLERISTRTDVKKYFKKFNRYEHDNIEYVRLESVDEDLETSS